MIYVSVFALYRFKEWIGSGLRVDRSQPRIRFIDFNSTSLTRFFKVLFSRLFFVSSLALQRKKIALETEAGRSRSDA